MVSMLCLKYAAVRRQSRHPNVARSTHHQIELVFDVEPIVVAIVIVVVITAIFRHGYIHGAWREWMVLVSAEVVVRRCWQRAPGNGRM